MEENCSRPKPSTWDSRIQPLASPIHQHCPHPPPQSFASVFTPLRCSPPALLSSRGLVPTPSAPSAYSPPALGVCLWAPSSLLTSPGRPRGRESQRSHTGLIGLSLLTFLEKARLYRTSSLLILRRGIFSYKIKP